MKKENLNKGRGINKEQRSLSSKIANAIRFHRKKMDLSIHELSRRTGVSVSYLSRIENGIRKNVSIPVLKVISEGLDTNLFYYLDLFEDDTSVKSIEEIILKSDFLVKGVSYDSRKVKMLLIDVMTFITTDTHDINSNLTKQAKLIKMVSKFNKEVNKPSVK